MAVKSLFINILYNNPRSKLIGDYYIMHYVSNT